MILVAAVLRRRACMDRAFSFRRHARRSGSIRHCSACRRYFAVPYWVTTLLSFSVSAAVLLMLGPAVQAALGDATQQLRIAANERMVPGWLGHQHPQFGTFTGAVNVSAGIAALVLLPSSARVSWLARAYAVSIVVTLLFRIAALVRLRKTNRQPATYRTPWNIRHWRLDAPLGLGLVAAVALGGLLSALVLPQSADADHRRRDRAASAPLSLWRAVGRAHHGARNRRHVRDAAVERAGARAGRCQAGQHPRHDSKSACARARRQSPSKPPATATSSIMTVRVIGVDADEDGATATAPTPAERRLFTRVVALAEQVERPVQLMIVPSHDVFEAIVATVIRLKSSEVYVGESATLSADDQARLMGEAWEAAEKTESLAVRLVIYHHSGRTDAYHLGAHPPALGPGDLELIHRIWLDAVKAVGPQVHHHDVVRAALTQMEKQLTDQQRDEALAAIRQAARPADELADAVRARDFPRLRDIARNRHAADLAEMLTDSRSKTRWSPSACCRARMPPRCSSICRTKPGHAAQVDGPRRRRGAPQSDGARRPHDVPGGVARRRHAAAAVAADAGGAVGRRRRCSAIPKDSIGRLMTPHVRRGPRGLDRPAGARSHPRARPGQRDTERHLRGRRAGTAHRRHPASANCCSRRPTNHVHDLMDRRFIALESDRRPADRGRRVPQLRPHGAAGHRHRRHADRHRHDRRRARRRGSDGDQGNPAHRRI